jgi:hypothetical protein
MAIIESFLKAVTSKKLKLEDVRLEEKRLEVKEGQYLRKIEGLEKEKQEIFKKGAEYKNVALRRIYARKYEERSKRGVLYERDLIRINKELMVIGRLRMMLESRRESNLSGLLEKLSSNQMNEIVRMVEADNIKYGEFVEKLDTILGIVDQPISEMEAVTGEGMEVMKIWEKMDEGEFDFDSALKEATKVTRKEAELPAPEKSETEKSM